MSVIDVVAGTEQKTDVHAIKTNFKIMCLTSHSSAGGAQEIWYNLACGLKSRGHDVVLAALYPSRTKNRSTREDLPWTYIAPKRPSNPIDMVRLLFRLSKFLAEHKVDVMLTALPAANVMAPLAALFSGTPVRSISSHHSAVETHNPLLDRMDSWIGSLRRVAAIVCVSQTVMDSLAGKPDTYRKKSTVIYNGLPVEIEKQLDDLREQTLTSRQRQAAIATGRLAPQKNYPLIVRAAKFLHSAAIDIVGTGPDETDLKALAASEGGNGKITFCGFMERAEVLKKMSNSGIFLQPSLFEGHSLALIEAARLGLPLIVSDTPAQREATTLPDGAQGAILVDQHNPAALADAINLIAENAGVYNDLSAKALQLAGIFSFERMIDAYERLLVSVVRK